MFTNYRRLLVMVDNHLRERGLCACPPQCDRCCRLVFSVFPVEAVYLLQAFRRLSPDVARSVERQADSSDRCAFLVDGRCAVYEFRPVLCRLHGYPFVRRAESGDPSGVFPGCEVLGMGSPRPSGEGSVTVSAVDLDAINTRLALVNRLFLREGPLVGCSLPDRIPVAWIPSGRFMEELDHAPV